ncbi:MAG TPA: MlaD family protein [Methylomirabilota bacterium]|nr:MlaD family protein [Methylomirabilota bacterium]
MENKRIATKVGLFVFIGLALAALLVVQFSKGTSLFHGTYELRLHTANVGGLKPRAGVLLAGVQVGTVSDIQLSQDDKSVTVFLKIYKRYEIYSDARFVIEQAGFLGDPYVSVIAVSNQVPKLTNGEVVVCQEPFNLQEVARSAAGFIQRVDVIAKKLDASVNEMQRVVLNAQTMTNFSVTVDNMRTFSEEALGSVSQINQLIATNGTQVSMAVSNVLLFSSDLMRLSETANGLMDTNKPHITAAVKNIETSTEILTNLMTQLQSGKGLAGSILQNQEMATNVQTIANNLAVASSNLNRLGLWGFLWHKEKEPRNKK